jgi:superfamily II RNA helicase
MMDNKEIFYDKVYRDWLDWRNKSAKQKDIHKRLVENRRAGGYEDPVVKAKTGGLQAFPAQLNACVRYLDTHGLMPALFFVFSRAGCEKYAGLVEGSLISSSDSAAIQHIWDFHLHPYKSILEHLPQAHTLLDLVKRGIAFHHSGLLPILREMVEILFGKGLLKVLFATETFAVGINMPTKTVVFLDLEKYTDEVAGGGIRPLRTDEYIQMAGRAGRRGKDTQGYVFYLPQREPVDVADMKTMLTGKKSSITSRMDFGYDFILKTLQTKNLRWTSIMESSYWEQQRGLEKKALEVQLEKLQASLESFQISETLQIQCQQREEAELKWKTSVNAAKKEAQKELDRLRNKQVGPAWESAWKLWQSIKKVKQEIQSLEVQIAELCVSYEDLLGPRFQCLQSWGFLGEDNTLTELGTLATEINEGHPILMSIAFQEKLVHGLDPSQFVAFLAGFLTETKMDNEPYLDDVAVPDAVRKALWTMNEYAEEYEKEEGAFANTKFWRLSTGWIEVLYRWFQGENPAVLCMEYGVYEGNLMRSVLKVSNMVEEWMNMATYIKDIEFLKAMEGLQEKLVRDIAKPDSLYLRLN